MDGTADISLLLDALTANTSAERFGELLATPSYPGAFPASASSLPIAPAFDMPLVAAHNALPPDPLSPSALLPNAAHLDLPAVLPVTTADYPLPLSVVTGASSRSDTASHSPELPIRKKRARSVTVPKPKHEQLLALANLSAASDVSSLPSRSASSKPRDCPVKHEPNTVPVAPPHTNSSCQPSPASVLSRENIQLAPSLPKSHTRKCREKVTKQFENLLEVLPRPPNGVEVKHKAQVLEYTIRMFRYLLLRRTSLQAEIALASKPALRQWMDGTIAAAAAALPRDARKHIPLSAVLEPFVGLYCVKEGWTYGEMWLVDEANQAALASCVFNTDDDAVLKQLNAFATMSKSQYTTSSHVKSGIINRVIASKRPEWLSELPSDPAVFDRAALAGEHGLCVTEAVPVMLDEKRCAGVLVFADVVPHKFSTGDMITLLDYASTLGRFYMDYLSHVQKGAYGQRPNEAKLEAKPIRSAELANGSPDRASASFPNAFPHGRQGVLGMASLHGFIPPSSETSTSFFGESNFVAGG